jgi:hypothetical protein
VGYLQDKLLKCFSRICGLPGSSNRAQYAGGISGDSTQAKAIEKAIISQDYTSMTGEQLDYISRILSASQAFIWGMIRDQCEIKVRPWRPKKGQPAVSKNERIGYDFDLASWRDHPSIEVYKDGKIAYISEPYSLGHKSFRQLVSLIDDGWDVSVSAAFSTHYPGSTVKIIIQKKDK